MEKCCDNKENLYRRENDPEESEDVIIYRCKVCGRRHFEVKVDQGTFDFKGGNL